MNKYKTSYSRAVKDYIIDNIRGNNPISEDIIKIVEGVREQENISLQQMVEIGLPRVIYLAYSHRYTRRIMQNMYKHGPTPRK
jgi:hypothetical protein